MGKSSFFLCLFIANYKVVKETSLKYIPFTEKPRLSQFWRKRFKLLDIIRLRAHKRRIICHKGLNKAVIIGIFSVLIYPVDKYPFDVFMSPASGIAGIVHTFRKGIHTSYTGSNAFHLKFGKLSCLIDENNVVLCTLQSVQVTVAVTIHKIQGAAVDEHQNLIPVVVQGCTGQFFL